MQAYQTIASCDYFSWIRQEDASVEGVLCDLSAINLLHDRKARNSESIEDISFFLYIFLVLVDANLLRTID